MSPRRIKIRFASESRTVARFICPRDRFWGGVPFGGRAVETFSDFGRSDAGRVHPPGRTRYQRPREHHASDTRVLRLTRADARCGDQAMCNAFAGEGGACDDASDGGDRDDASDVSAGAGASGNGIGAASRSSRTFGVTRTGSASRTGSTSVTKYTGSATGTGATASAGAPGRPIGADRARCGDSPRTRPGLRPHVRARPFCKSQRLSVRQHQRAAAAPACSRVQIGVQSLQLQICDR
jgi:hypothetical protein